MIGEETKAQRGEVTCPEQGKSKAITWSHTSHRSSQLSTVGTAGLDPTCCLVAMWPWAGPFPYPWAPVFSPIKGTT